MTFKRIDECCYRGQRLYQRTIQQREEAQVTSHTTISTTVIITPISTITIITHIILTSTITTTVCQKIDSGPGGGAPGHVFCQVFFSLTHFRLR